MDKLHEQHNIFEDQVRRIARQLWSSAESGGAQMYGGQERDGVFETEECVHLVEATVSRAKDKAVSDARKLADHARALRREKPSKAVKCWLVTQHEPTAEQRGGVSRYAELVVALSFSQFQSKLVDAATYLDLRENYPFGSIRDPVTGVATVEIEYVPLDLIESSKEKLWGIAEIRSAVEAGSRFIALGDYGAGKSMTLREVYRELRRHYLGSRSPKFPVYLNLRDHFGQTNPAEVLERHARNIGFPTPSHLVRAWRAGYVILLLDGFDELTTGGIQGLWKRLQDTRYRAMQAVRELVRAQPRDCGIVLAGRAHFFDTDAERTHALGSGRDWVELTLSEFSDEQIRRYLDRRGLKGKVPSWLPSRPLLVGYLAAAGILESALSGANAGGNTRTLDPAAGWDLLLDRICEREAEIEAGIDGPTVRKILERLATFARASSSGLGPLRADHFTSAFMEICGYQPDEKGAVLLQRLPGLGVDRSEEGTRSFLNQELADACRCGDVVQYIADPFTMNAIIFRGAECGLGQLGIGIGLIRCERMKLSNGKMNPVIKKAAEMNDVGMLLIDLCRMNIELGYDINTPVEIRDMYVPWIDVVEGLGQCANLQFRSCYFSRVGLDDNVPGDRMPRFADCYIDELDGRSSRQDLPEGVFDSACEFGHFSEAPETTSAISGMDLPLGTRVLLSLLKKIYLQSGSGRKENALHRGLDHHGRRLVGPVLRILQSEGLVSPYRRAGLDMTIWVPDRSQSDRVAKMVTGPRTCGDPLLAKVSALQ